jgi:hypothetical protein
MGGVVEERRSSFDTDERDEGVSRRKSRLIGIERYGICERTDRCKCR